MRDKPTDEEIQVALAAAREAVDQSRERRKRLSRRRTPRRRIELEEARAAASAAAAPLRSYIGMIAWHDLSNEIEVKMKHAMRDLRYERGQLDKMMSP